LARPFLRPLLAGLVLALVLAAPAHASVLEPRAAHSPNADDIRTAYWVAIIVATLVLVAVNLAIVATLVRFRESRDREPSRFTAGHGAFRRPLIPVAALAAGLFAFGVIVNESARDVEASGAAPLAADEGEASAAAIPKNGEPIHINAIAQLWLWRFEYPGGTPGNRVFSYNELVVPVDTPVVLHLDSTDVRHRWFVPALGGQVDAVPGSDAEAGFTADSEGAYPGQSTAFSGTGYPAMRSWVRVVGADDYERFIADKRSELETAQSFVQNRIESQAATE
jgi:cytochrome c oxidase subunit II